MRKRHEVVSDFYGGASGLRAHFEDRVAEPWRASEGRFVWDYWHVPTQFTYIRTPAFRFFPRELIVEFEHALTSWGRRQLGCGRINTCWLSYYVEGCYQGLHTDVRHGPWAYSFSLTSPERARFLGGETQLLKETVLDYWRSGADAYFRSEKGGSDISGLFDCFPSVFNQLLVFDGRIPHCVSRVEGTQNPAEGRLAVHGWFSAPKLFTDGALTAEETLPVLADALQGVVDDASELAAADGMLVLRLSVGESGHVDDLAVLTDLLETSADAPEENTRLRELVTHRLRELRFPARGEPTEITLPVDPTR